MDINRARVQWQHKCNEKTIPGYFWHSPQCSVLPAAKFSHLDTREALMHSSWYLQRPARSTSPHLTIQGPLGKTIVMVLVCHSSECGCFV